MLCEICHELEATIHTTACVPGGTPGVPASHFCRECFQTRGPIAGMQIVEGVVDICHYCGAQCDFGASPSKRISVIVPGAVTACRQCGDDLNEYVQNHVQAFSSEEEFTRNLEAYMKKRVAERRSET